MRYVNQRIPEPRSKENHHTHNMLLDAAFLSIAKRAPKSLAPRLICRRLCSVSSSAALHADTEQAMSLLPLGRDGKIFDVVHKHKPSALDSAIVTSHDKDAWLEGTSEVFGAAVSDAIHVRPKHLDPLAEVRELPCHGEQIGVTSCRAPHSCPHDACLCAGDCIGSLGSVCDRNGQ